MKKELNHEFFLEMDINTDVLDKETTYNPLLDGFKSDGSGIGRKDTQALSGKIINDVRRKTLTMIRQQILKICFRILLGVFNTG